MAAEILTQSESFAELAAFYSQKAVAEAHTRLQVVLEFKSLRPKTVQANGFRLSSPAVEELAQRAGVSVGTLWRWYRLYRLAYDSTQGSIHTKAKAGFEALISRPRGRAEDPCSDRRRKVDEDLRQAIAGLYARRKAPSQASQLNDVPG